MGLGQGRPFSNWAYWLHQDRNPNKFKALNELDMKVHFGLLQLSFLALAWAMMMPAQSIGMGG